MQRHTIVFAHEVDAWRKEISEFNAALKELGDVENWSRKLHVDLQIVHNTLQRASNASI